MHDPDDQIQVNDGTAIKLCTKGRDNQIRNKDYEKDSDQKDKERHIFEDRVYYKVIALYKFF